MVFERVGLVPCHPGEERVRLRESASLEQAPQRHFLEVNPVDHLLQHCWPCITSKKCRGLIHFMLFCGAG